MFFKRNGKGSDGGAWRTISEGEVPAAVAAFLLVHPDCGKATDIQRNGRSLMCWCELCEDLRTYRVNGADAVGIGANGLRSYLPGNPGRIGPDRRIEKSVVVKAAVKEVFGYVGDPANLPEVWPSLVEVRDVERLPNGGHRTRWVYKMAGLRFEGTSEDLEYVANRHIVAVTEGGVETFMAWRFQPEADGTKVSYESEYRIPVPLIGKLTGSVIAEHNEREIETVLANLSSRLGS